MPSFPTWRRRGGEGPVITRGWAPLFRWAFISRPNTFSFLSFFFVFQARRIDLFSFLFVNIFDLMIMCLLLLLLLLQEIWIWCVLWQVVLVNRVEKIFATNFFPFFKLMNSRGLISRNWIELVENKQFLTGFFNLLQINSVTNEINCIESSKLDRECFFLCYLLLVVTFVKLFKKHINFLLHVSDCRNEWMNCFFLK